MQKINAKEVVIALGLSLIPVIIVSFTFEFDPKIIVHKTMNHGKYDIVIISRSRFPRLTGERELYADIWSNQQQIYNHHIVHISGLDEYNSKIKDITVLPSTGELMVEFTPSGYSKSGTRIDLYKIGEDSGD
jgi:hypothetical protein